MQTIGRRRRLWFVAMVVGWFAGFYFYVFLRVRPELFFQQSPAVFLLDEDFFAAFLKQPGGLVAYGSAFLSPLLAFGWLGALIITLLTALVCLATRQVLAAAAPPDGSVLFLVPSLLVLLMSGQYNHPISLCVGLCAVLGLAGAYQRVGGRHSAVRLTLFLILSALAYWAAAGLYVVFALLCGIFEWPVHRRWWLGMICVLSAIAVPMVVGRWFCVLSIDDVYRGLFLPKERYWLAVPSSALVSQAIRTALLLFFPIAALASAWRRRPEAPSTASLETAPPVERPDGEVGAAGRPMSALRLVVPPAVLIALAVVADVLLFDAATKHSLLMAYHADREQWTDVLTSAQRLPPSDVWYVFQINRALYHRDELLERMFAYPQVANSAPTLTLQFESLAATAERAPLECSDILFELGRINESEHMAYEAMELFGERPRTLQRLLDLHVIKGQPDAARRFLAVLERSLLHGGWARDRLRQLDADPTLAGDPVIASRRALMMDQDYTGNLDAETMLNQLLQRNPRNRMAFEYLMAYYLLTRQIDKLVANLHRFDDFGQTLLPRHCEEAILIHLDKTGSRGIDLRGRQIRPETQRRGKEFGQAAGRVQGNPSAAFAALQHDFGDTYFFFYVFGRNDARFAQARPSP